MPPDENKEDINNSVFTNTVANFAVSTARWAACLAFGEDASVEEIPEAWLEKMANLTFLFNAEKRYHEEYEGFDAEKEAGNGSDE